MSAEKRPSWRFANLPWIAQRAIRVSAREKAQTNVRPTRAVDGAESNPVGNDVYQIVTDRIVGLLESGTVPWRQPWIGSSQTPQNLVSRRAYRGVNFFLLGSAGFPTPFWLTFGQAKELGGTVRQGERSWPVVFWKIFEDEEGDKPRTIPLLRYYRVFNVAQCDGIESPAAEQKGEPFQPIKRCERTVAAMPNPPTIRHGGDRAIYFPPADEVRMPAAERFASPEGYYCTLFHELTHATGHRTRLNRREVAEPHGFGGDPYAREELVAEMGAAFLCGHCEIMPATVENSASYIRNWLGRLKDDRRLVVQAAGQAQKACDFILGVQPASVSAADENHATPV